MRRLVILRSVILRSASIAACVAMLAVAIASAAPRPVPPKTWVVEESSAFDRDLAALHAGGVRAPADSDAILRERVIRAALEMDPRPEVSPAARHHFETGRLAIAANPTHETLEASVLEFATALDLAPWWADAYRAIADPLEQLGRTDEAALSLELYLVAEPKARDWEAARLRIKTLRARAAAR